MKVFKVILILILLFSMSTVVVFAERSVETQMLVEALRYKHYGNDAIFTKKIGRAHV